MPRLGRGAGPGGGSTGTGRRRGSEAVIGRSSVKLDKDTIIPSYTLFADSVFCDYDPIKKKADIGSNLLERE